MNIIKTLRKIYLSIFLASLTLFVCCNITKEKSRNIVENNQVAFYSKLDSTMYSIDLEKNKKIKLFTFETNNHSSVKWPCWSPDGKKIAYMGQRNGVYGSYYFDLHSKKHTKFWEGDYKKGDLAVPGGVMDWHKDLGPLIGIKENEIGNTDTHVLKDSLFKTFEKGNTETYDFFKLRDTAYINLTQNKWDQRTHPQQIFWTFFVRAHSNGNISFWGTEEDENNGFGENLYIIDSNGENRKKIFNYPEGVNGAGANMLEYDISEDGKWLLFSLDGDIVLIELENPESTINLTNSKDQIDIMPKFNSNDTKIVYSSGNGEHFNIFTMDFDGENKQVHTTGKNYYVQSRYKLNY